MIFKHKLIITHICGVPVRKQRTIKNIKIIHQLLYR